jgi:hypothetical protein
LQRHDGFARTDVALQQPTHWVRLAHVGDDLAQGPLLRRRGMKRQHFADGFAHRGNAGSSAADPP